MHLWCIVKQIELNAGQKLILKHCLLNNEVMYFVSYNFENHSVDHIFGKNDVTNNYLQFSAEFRFENAKIWFCSILKWH